MQSTALRHTPIPAGSAAMRHLAWYAGGAVLAFVVPFVFTSLFDTPSDLYYAIYFAAVLAYLAAYVVRTGTNIVAMFTRHWRWSAAIGVLTAAFLVFTVLNREDSTARPDGLYFAFTIAWRGLLYGAVDALLLTAFPMAVALALLGGKLGTMERKVSFAALTAVLVIGITAVYHLGYEQYRKDGVAQPETGNGIISVPALLTTNPLGSLIAHASMHITADIHAYETDVYLPPQTEAD